MVRTKEPALGPMKRGGLSLDHIEPWFGSVSSVKTSSSTSSSLETGNGINDKIKFSMYFRRGWERNDMRIYQDGIPPFHLITIKGYPPVWTSQWSNTNQYQLLGYAAHVIWSLFGRYNCKVKAKPSGSNVCDVAKTRTLVQILVRSTLRLFCIYSPLSVHHQIVSIVFLSECFLCLRIVSSIALSQCLNNVEFTSSIVQFSWTTSVFI